MLYSHSYQERALDSFASFLRNVLAGDDRYKPLVEPVIKGTKSLVKHEIDYFGVDRSAYDIIVFLAETAPEFFKDINLENISKDDYDFILKLITAQREMPIA